MQVEMEIKNKKRKRCTKQLEAKNARVAVFMSYKIELKAKGDLVSKRMLFTVRRNHGSRR